MANIYRRYALRITKCVNAQTTSVDPQTYSIWNYFDSKKEMLKDHNLYSKDRVQAYIFVKNTYTLLSNA